MDYAVCLGRQLVDPFCAWSHVFALGQIVHRFLDWLVCISVSAVTAT